ncbi:hypothetical protein VNO77_03688 [Canavalia gladiata]|uniref:Uncharacterized protein n=1 Tax=Canavalia gladiata TaxID=3824 RepID=A0AAN9N0A0_CANGL
MFVALTLSSTIQSRQGMPRQFSEVKLFEGRLGNSRDLPPHQVAANVIKFLELITKDMPIHGLSCNAHHVLYPVLRPEVLLWQRETNIDHLLSARKKIKSHNVTPGIMYKRLFIKVSLTSASMLSIQSILAPLGLIKMELKEQLSDGLMEPEIETMPRSCDPWNWN